MSDSENPGPESGADSDPAAEVAVAIPPAPSEDAIAVPMPAERLRIEEPPAPTPLKPVWVAAVLAAAVCADLALRRPPWNNVATALLVLVVAVGLLASGFVRSRSAKILLALAVLFGGFIAWRTDPLLTLFNFVVAFSLLAAGAATGTRQRLWDIGPGSVLKEGVLFFEQLVVTPFVGMAEALARYRTWGETGDSSSKAAVRGVAIAAPIVLILGLLLASADVVFRSFFTSVNLGGGGIFVHLFLAAIGAVAMAALLRYSTLEHSETRPLTEGRFGAVEVGVILGAIVALFSVFAVAQVLTVVGGADEALARAGLDQKQFARQGFFQLIWVAAITLGVVMTLQVLSRNHAGASRNARVGGYVTVGLTLMIVAVAVMRISFYVDDSGLTSRRLYAFVVSAWIAAAFGLLALRLRGFRLSQAWLFPAIAAVGVVMLFGLNLFNPQRLVAENNLDRNQDVLAWHVRYSQFHGDGAAKMAEGLDRLSPELAATVQEELCYISPGSLNDQPDWLSYNVGKERARKALLELCG